MKRIAEVAKGEAKEEEGEEEDEEREEEQDVHMEDVPHNEEKGVWEDVPSVIPITETWKKLKNELSKYFTLVPTSYSLKEITNTNMHLLFYICRSNKIVLGLWEGCNIEHRGGVGKPKRRYGHQG